MSDRIASTSGPRIGRVLRVCLRQLPLALIFAGIVSVAAWHVLRHFPPSYSATSVVWLGSREAAILASQSAWSTVAGRKSDVEDGRTIGAVLKSVPVLRRVTISLGLYEDPELLKPRMAVFLGALLNAGADGAEAAPAPEPRRANQDPVQITALDPSSGATNAVDVADLAGVAPVPVSGYPDNVEAAIRVASNALASNLTVNVDTSAEIAVITYKAPDPDLAAAIVNEIPAAFAAERRERMREGTTGAAEWLAKRVEVVRAEVDRKEAAIQSIRAKYGIVPGTLNRDPQDIERVTAGLDEARRGLATATRALERAQADLATGGSNVRLFNSPLMQQLADLRARAISERRTLLTQVSEDHELIRTVDARLAGLDEEANAEKRRLIGEYEAEVANAQAAVDAAQQRVDDVRANASAELERDAKAEAAVAAFSRELEADKTLYRSLVARLQEARQVAEVDSGGISVIQSALPPASPSIIGRPLIVATAASFSFALALACVAAMALLDRRIVDPEQVRAAGLSVIVAAPAVVQRTRRRRSAVRRSRPELLFDEAIRRLFAAIRNSAGPDSDHKRVVMVTSGASREGKSVAARALAACAAVTGMSTVLVEGDMRRIARRKAWDVSNPGLAGVLHGDAVLDEVLIVRDDHGADVVPTTQTVPYSTELIASPRMRDLVIELRNRYDIVIIDMPPVCMAADCELLAPYTDATILVIQHAHATIARTRRALEILARAGSTRPIAFVNKADHRFFDENFGFGEHAYGATPGRNRRRPSLWGWLDGRSRKTSAAHAATLAQTDFTKELFS
ncbi:MAG: hypothetical protein AcusKO_00440 [Acuticoccus sp.]